MFVDFTAVDRVRTDAIGPGLRFAIAAMEVCSRVLARDNEVTVRWVSALYGIAGSGERTSKLGLRRREVFPQRPRWGLVEDQPPAHDQGRYREQASCDCRVGLQPHRARATIQPPPERGLRQKDLRRMRKFLAGRFYQLFSEHALIGALLHCKMMKADRGGC